MRENGDIIESLYFAEYAALLRYATVVLGDSDTAQDIVQDTFHEAVRKAEVLREHPKPRAWLMTTLKYKLQSALRKRSNTTKMLIALELNFSENALDLVDNKIELTQVISTMEKYLSPEDFYIFRRYFLESASHCQLAEELNITVWASQKRIERIRKDVKRRFPERAGLRVISISLFLLCVAGTIAKECV